MSTSPAFTRAQWIVLCVCVAIFALGQFHRASGSVFTPILMDRYAISAALAGGLVSAMFFATIAAQVPFGVALDRIGPRRVLGVCILIVACGTGVFAFGQSFDVTLMSRILIGVGLASMGAATYVIIGRNFSKGDFGYVSGLVVTLGGIGGLLGTYPLALALERAPWVTVFTVVTGVTLALALFVFLAIPRTPPPDTTKGEGDTGGYLSLLQQPEFLKILALGIVSFAPITTITGLWGGPFLQNVAGLSPEGAGAALLALFLATISAGYVFGRLDRRARSRKRVVLTAVVVSCGSLFLLASWPSPSPLIAVALLLIMVFCQQFYVPLGAHMRATVPDHLLGRASTLLSLISVAAIPALQITFGAVLDMTAGLGWGVDQQYRAAFAVMGALIAGCGLVYATARHAGGA